MTLRHRFLITAALLCHLLLAPPLVYQPVAACGCLFCQASWRSVVGKIGDCSGHTLRSRIRRTVQSSNRLCHPAGEEGVVYKLHGAVEIYYETYVLRADEATFNSDTNEVTASGHFALDGGPNDDHIRASHGTYNFALETGKFYDVTGTTGMRYRANRPILTSTGSLRIHRQAGGETHTRSLPGVRGHNHHLRVAASELAV